MVMYGFEHIIKTIITTMKTYLIWRCEITHRIYSRLPLSRLKALFNPKGIDVMELTENFVL